jgi:hypothetical protein
MPILLPSPRTYVLLRKFTTFKWTATADELKTANIQINAVVSTGAGFIDRIPKWVHVAIVPLIQ